MARKPRILIPGGLYHVTSRGNERQVVFRDDRDRLRFLERLADSLAVHDVRVFLYCLMPNHLHLLVETPKGNLDRFMGSLLTGYAVYFNLRHPRAGHLMQGRYGAQVVEGNEYLLKLSRYVHLNPVQVTEIRERSLTERIRILREYRWSSFREYAGLVPPCGWLTTGPLLSMTAGARTNGWGKAYAQYVERGLARTDREFVQLMNQGGMAIGSDDFVESVKSHHGRMAEQVRKREDLSMRHIQTWKSEDEVRAAVRKITGLQWNQVERRKTGGAVRGFLAWALQKYAGKTQREIARQMGVTTGAAVSLMIRRTMTTPQIRKWRERLNLTFKG